MALEVVPHLEPCVERTRARVVGVLAGVIGVGGGELGPDPVLAAGSLVDDSQDDGGLEALIV